MKLTEGFITHVLDGDQVMVSVKEGQFSGLVRSNETAAFIIDCLKEETTVEDIVEQILSEYDGVSKEQVQADVENVLEKLRSIGAVDETV